MDIFNKKAIKQLFQAEIENRKNLIDIVKRLDKLENKKEYFSAYEALPEDSLDYQLMKTMKAIIDYLGVQIKIGIEEDPNYLKPQPQMRKRYKAVKIKK